MRSSSIFQKGVRPFPKKYQVRYFQAQDYFWDQLTAAVLTDESPVTFEDDPLCVVEEEGPQSGQTQVPAGCPNIRVAVSADATRFEQVFLETLNNP